MLYKKSHLPAYKGLICVSNNWQLDNLGEWQDLYNIHLKMEKKKHVRMLLIDFTD